MVQAEEDEAQQKDASQVIEEQFQANVLKEKIASMNSELLEFSKTLDQEHFQSAIDMRNELLQDHIETPELQITTK